MGGVCIPSDHIKDNIMIITEADIDNKLREGIVIDSIGPKRLVYYVLTCKYEVQVNGHIVMLGSDEHKTNIINKYNSISI